MLDPDPGSRRAFGAAEQYSKTLGRRKRAKRDPDIQARYPWVTFLAVKSGFRSLWMAGALLATVCGLRSRSPHRLKNKITDRIGQSFRYDGKKASIGDEEKNCPSHTKEKSEPKK